MKKDIISTAVKGMCVGGTMLVPGVSGGSMAMILGVYDKLVSSVSSFMKHKKDSILFLALFSVGAILGMVLFAKPLLALIEKYPMPMLYFFIGAVAGGIPMMYKKAEVKKVSLWTFLYPVLGLAAVYLLSMLPADIFNSRMDGGLSSFLLLMAAGIIAAVALVLPGISVSYMLLIMGMYDETMRAISGFYLPYLLPLGVGVVLGIILTTSMLERAMLRYPQPTYLIILGFIVGSVLEVFPGIPVGTELIFCLIMILAGFTVIRLISKNEIKEIA